MPMSPTEFSTFIDKEIKKWGTIVKASAQKPN
jgi:tripartite-type tricarboxylate transporter receptor subunit TctC